MDAMGRKQGNGNTCIENPNYDDFKAAGKPVGCGNYIVSYVFFFTFISLVSIIFLNLFVAIILNGYFDTKDKQNYELDATILGNF
jgi:hypothetical protein